jgi:hypothetical protein
MNTRPETLRADLSQLAQLLHKYGLDGQAAVVDEIVATPETSTPDYKRLASIDMWGGSGAVWDGRCASSPPQCVWQAAPTRRASATRSSELQHTSGYRSDENWN